MVLYEDDGKTVKFYSDAQHHIADIEIWEIIEFFITNDGLEEMN